MKTFAAFASIVALFGASALGTDWRAPAPSSPQSILLVPYGSWSMCEANPSLSNSPYCAGLPVYVKGQEPDLLLLTASRSDTVAFAYTITGMDVNSDLKSYTGTFLRNDRLPSVVASWTVVNAGMLQNATITVQELSSTVLRQQTLNMGGN